MVSATCSRRVLWALGMSAAHADDNNTLYFYNWTEYEMAVTA